MRALCLVVEAPSRSRDKAPSRLDFAVAERKTQFIAALTGAERERVLALTGAETDPVREDQKVGPADPRMAICQQPACRHVGNCRVGLACLEFSRLTRVRPFRARL